ncbi:MAG: hypothetical protein KC466_14515, partial [Myxococcales bacterium]|nr:hypothetical protein [Myxococcales bacterium]
MTIKRWTVSLLATAALVAGALMQMGFVAKEGTATLSGGCIGYANYRDQSSPRSFRAGDKVLIHGYNKGTLAVSDWIKVSRPEGGPTRWLHKRCFNAVTIEGQRVSVDSSILPIGDIEDRVRGLEEKSAAAAQPAPVAPTAP